MQTWIPAHALGTDRPRVVSQPGLFGERDAQWNCTDHSENTVATGSYEVCFEITSGTSQVQVVAKNVQERSRRLDIHGMACAIHSQRDLAHGGFSLTQLILAVQLASSEGSRSEEDSRATIRRARFGAVST